MLQGLTMTRRSASSFTISRDIRGEEEKGGRTEEEKYGSRRREKRSEACSYMRRDTGRSRRRRKEGEEWRSSLASD